MPCEFLHDNLVLHSRTFYSLQRGKRVFAESPDSWKHDTYFTFEACLYPPPLLLPLTWERYGYTLEDVQQTYDKTDASYVWALSLLLLPEECELEAAGAGVRSTFQSLFSFLFISRKGIFDLFLRAHERYLSPSTPSVLCQERPDHKPLLPRVIVSGELFEWCRLRVPERPPSFAWVAHYEATVPYRDVWLVPIEHDTTHRLVCMNRVIKREVYEAIPVQPKSCVVTLPVVVSIGPERTEYVMVEEACFFALQGSTQAKRKKKQKTPPKKEARLA